VRLEAALTGEHLRIEVGDEGPGFVPITPARTSCPLPDAITAKQIFRRARPPFS
jgi:hypothetical protein